MEKEVHIMKDKPKHVWYSHLYWKHFRVVKETWEKGDRKNEIENVVLTSILKHNM